MDHHRYIIVGGGLAAASAIRGIRAHDREGSILLLTRENHAPYHRSLLTKDVWTDPEGLSRLPLHDDAFYSEHGVKVGLRREVVEIETASRTVWDERGERYQYESLLIATGSRPRRLTIPGADASALRYFRDLEDYLAMENRLERLQHITLLGGSFTGVEMAAALRHRGKEVTLIYPDEYPLYHLLPRDLGLSVANLLRERGVETVSGETLVEIDERGEFVRARTHGGDTLTTQFVLADSGADPQTELADTAGLDTDNGIVVDERTRTSAADVFAAGDVAEFPYLTLGQLMRVECADHAAHHGYCAGENMGGAEVPYTWLPALWFQLFELRFEGVGDLDARLDTEEVWSEPGREGAVFYLRDDIVRGVLLCGQPDRIEAARALLRETRPTTPAERVEAVSGAVR